MSVFVKYIYGIFSNSPYRDAQILQICFLVLLRYILSDFTQFVDPENIGVNTGIMIICQLELDI